MNFKSDIIVINPEEVTSPYYKPPYIPASDPDYIKHVYCEGAIFHIVCYDTEGIHCSEPKCILNKPGKE